jgi:DDB1- and CUL4-associated factor 13
MALNNGLDFHPITTSQYLNDTHLEELLFMVSDVLFNPVWLNNKCFQLNRPLPLLFGAGISSLGCLIGLDTDDWADPLTSVAMPSTQAATLQVVGLEGFFKGAYTYHWHT